MEETHSHIATVIAPRLKAMLRDVETTRQRDMKPLDARRYEMTAAHKVERQRLDEGQSRRWIVEARDRAARLAEWRRGAMGPAYR